MKYTLLSTGLALSALVFAAPPQGEANRIRESADSAFVTAAARGGLAEVELGNLALQKGANEDVKKFGQRMVDDHSRANDELKSLASRKGMSVGETLTAKDNQTKRRLATLQGAAFDRAYMEDMVNDHKEDVAEFQREADHGSDPEVKAWAAKTLPTLQEHLKMAEDTLSRLR